MIKIIIKLIEFFLNSGLIPSQKDQMPQKIFPMLTKIMFENIKRDIKLLSSMSTSIPVLHQQIRGGGSMSLLIALTQGGVEGLNCGKHADIILERSLTCIHCVLFLTAICSFTIINILYDG